jgi:hypothetical protein
MRGSALI